MKDASYRDRTIDTAIISEAVGVVNSAEQLEAVADALAKAGFDRGDIDLMASRDTINQEFGADKNLPEIADHQRRELTTDSDRFGASVLTFGTLISIGSLGAALPVLASGGAVAAAIGAAAAGGAVGTGIGKIIRDRIIGKGDADSLEDALNDGGMVVLVRVRNPDDRAKVLNILNAVGAKDVHVHEVELKKTLHDVPLASIIPDPLLGNRRLAG